MSAIAIIVNDWDEAEISKSLNSQKVNWSPKGTVTVIGRGPNCTPVFALHRY